MSNLVNEPMIPPNRKRRRNHDESENQDRLSELPDCVILHILSFLYTNDAVKTCILSTRWKHLWKRIPALILHTNNSLMRDYGSGFPNLKSFDKFVTSILSLRDDSIALRTFDYDRNGSTRPQILRKIATYILSHSSQLHRLGLSITGDSCLIMPCVSACHALTSLKLSFSYRGPYNFDKILFPKSLYLPALTSLDLANFAFSADDNVDHAEPFSAFNILNSLIICNCAVRGAQILRISSATLVTLTIDGNSAFNNIELFAPSLCTLAFMGTPNQKLCGNSLSSIKHVNIDAHPIFSYEEHALVLFSWLLDLPNIASLVVTTHALLVLSLIPDLLKVEFPSLCNLKSLKVKMRHISCIASVKLEAAMLKNKPRKEASKIKKAFKAGVEPAATIPDRIVAFLCQNSPSAEVNFIPG